MSNAQDYTGYTEKDTATVLTVAASTITVASLDSDEEVYVTYDFTASYFSEDFEHTLNFECTATTGSEICYLWAMCDTVDEIGALITADTDLLTVYWTNATLTLLEQNGASGTDDSSAAALSEDTTYYLRIVRDESVGTYGTLYCYIYTDPSYMTLVDKLTVTLTEKKNFRYLYAVSGQGDGGGGVAWSGTINDLVTDVYPYTLENMRTRIRDLINESTALFWTDAELNRLINDGERDVAIKSLCLESIDSLSTTDAIRLVAFTGYKAIYLEYVPSGTNRGLVEILPVQLGRFPFNSTEPQYWFENGLNVGIDPLPDATYTLNAYVADYPSTEMSANPDIPQIPDDFRPLIVLYAYGRALQKEGRFPQARLILSIYNNELLYSKMDRIINIPTDKEGFKHN